MSLSEENNWWDCDFDEMEKKKKQKKKKKKKKKKMKKERYKQSKQKFKYKLIEKSVNTILFTLSDIAKIYATNKFHSKN